MSVQSSVPLFQAARAAAISFGPTSRQAKSNLEAAVIELQQEPGAANPPIADWILLGEWMMQQLAIGLDIFLAFVDMILAAAQHWLEEHPPE